MVCCYFSINLRALSSSCCCIIVASSTSLIIICYLSSRLCTSSSSSCCSSKASWASLGELIYHLFGTDFLQSIFDGQFRKKILLVLQQCRKDLVVIGGRSKPFVYRCPYMVIFTVWVDIGMCYWPRIWVDGVQCKYLFICIGHTSVAPYHAHYWVVVFQTYNRGYRYTSICPSIFLYYLP